ncbi:MAG TPA: MFS transporter [Acidobacteriaceae bacterium]|nr:MFS transporter [Acidobacteriaceae bacterium]
MPATPEISPTDGGRAGLSVAARGSGDVIATHGVHWGRRRAILLVVFVTYSLAYLDRANYGFGAAAGMAHTLSITQGRTALLGGLFFLGYFAFQVPGMLAAKRYSCTRLVFVALIAWGTLAALTGVLHQFWLLALDRLLLGVAESMIFPALLLLLTRWFTKAERSRANTMLMLGNPVTVLWMSAITGYLIERFGWQHTFILEGIPSVVWALVWIFTMRDQPKLARWFPQAAAEHLTCRLEDDQRAIPVVAGAKLSLGAALLRGDVVLLSVQYFCWSLGVYGFVLWLPSIVRRGASLGMGRTGLVSAAPYLAAILLMLLVSTISDRTQLRREMVWPPLLISGLALMGSFLLAPHGFWGAFVCLIVAGGCMYAPYGPFFSIFPERIPQSRVGEVMALVNSAGALGGFAGTYLVGLLQAVTGNARAGYLLMSLSLVASAVLTILLPKQKTPIGKPEVAHA